MGIVAFALLLLGATGARADQLDTGKQLYHELDYDAARVALLKAAELIDPHRRAEAYLYLGLIDTVEGDDAVARRSFRNGLVLDPTLELPLGTSPKVARIFDKVKAEISRNNASMPPPRPKQALPVAETPPPQPAPPRVESAPPQSVQATPVPSGEGGAEVMTKAQAPSSHAGRWVAGALFLVGLAAVGAGIYYGVQEAAAESSFKKAPSQQAAQPYQADANTDAVIADVLYGAGGAVGITGLSLWFVF